MRAPWAVKHRPKHLNEIVGNREVMARLRDWVLSWRPTPTGKKAILLYGPPGTGKTVSIEALANDLGLDLIEVNASDQRNRQVLERLLGSAVMQRELYGRKRIILIDEIDGINPAEDRGAIDTIVDIIEATQYPVVLTANNPWDPRLAPLRDRCELVEFRRLGIRDSLPYLRSICAKEGVEADEQALKFIVERNRGDMRSILNDLETCCVGRDRLAYDDVSWISYRDREQPVFEALGLIFNAKDCRSARQAVEIAGMDYEMLFEWVYENLPRQLTDPVDLANAMDSLARANLYLTWVKKRQSWELLGYFLDMMTAGVAMARDRTRPGWNPMRFPERIKLMSKTRPLRALRSRIGGSIAGKCHISSDRSLLHYAPYLKFIFENSPEMAAKLADWLNLDEESVEFLAGSTESAKAVSRLMEKA